MPGRAALSWTLAALWAPARQLRCARPERSSWGAVLLLMLCAALCVSCSSAGDRPSLLQVLNVQPSELSSGDELEVIGNQFPEGKPATITLRGSLHRPGQLPQHGVEIVIAASSSSRNRVNVVLDDAAVAEFTGRGAAALHTTFRGQVSAAFAPRAPGAPPVSGVVENVQLDFFPLDVPAAVSSEQEREGQLALELVGIELEPQRPGLGFVVKQVSPGGRAEAAGVRPADRLMALDGVRLSELSDFIPSGRRQFAEVELTRGRLGESLRRQLDVQGFREAPPEDFLWAGVVVGLAALVCLSFLLPMASVVGWFERRVVHRLRAVGRDVEREGVLGWMRRGVASIFREEVVPGSDHPVGRVVPYLMFLGSSALFMVLSFGHALASPELDLGLLFIGVVTALVCTGLMLGGWRSTGRWSLTGGVVAALQTLSHQLPTLGSILVVVLFAGSVRLGDIVAAQGGLPWQWFLFENPITFVMGLLFFTPALSEGSRAHPELPEADWEPAGPGSLSGPISVRPRFTSIRSRYLMFFAEWGHVFILSGLGAILFLGGWQLPGVPRGAAQASPALGLLAALVLALKAWGLTLLVLWVRWALPRIRVDQLMGICWRWFIPLAALGVIFTVGWLNALHSPLFRVAQAGLRYVLFAFTLLVPLYLTSRVASGLRSKGRELGVNPWL